MRRIPILLIALLVLCACVPTPEEEVVIHKNDGTLEQQLGATPVPDYQTEAEEEIKTETEEIPSSSGSSPDEPEQNTLRLALNAPETVRERFDGQAVGAHLYIEMDDEVEIPDVDKVPVLRGRVGYEPEKTAERIAKLLLGDGPYLRPGHSERAYIEPTLTYYQKWLLALDQKPYGPYADYDAIRENLQFNLNMGAESYRNATGENDRPDKPWTGSFEEAKEAFSISNGERSFSMHNVGISVFAYDAGNHPYIGGGWLDNPRGPRNEEERRWLQNAADFANSLGFARVMPQQINDADEMTRMRYCSETGFDSGYKDFTLLPVYEGIPVYPYVTMYGSDTGRQAAGVPFTRNLEQEEIFGTLYNGEVVQMQWNSPFTVTGVENENVPLLPFERIMEIFRRQVFMSVYLDKGYDLTYCVTGIRFSYMRVQVKDSDEYYLLPVWDFMGYTAHDWEQTPGEQAISQGVDSHMSILTVNAVDGSIIDRYLGN